MTNRMVFQTAIESAARKLHRIADEADKETCSKIRVVLSDLAYATAKIWKMPRIKR